MCTVPAFVVHMRMVVHAHLVKLRGADNSKNVKILDLYSGGEEGPLPCPQGREARSRGGARPEEAEPSPETGSYQLPF